MLFRSFTPLQMYESSPEALHTAFHSINGEKWYQRLHGWEVDDLISGVKTCGRLKNSNGYVDFKQLTSYFNPRFIADFIMYLIVLFIKQYLPNDLLGLLIQVLIGGMTYFMITYLQKDNILQILKVKISKR